MVFESIVDHIVVGGMNEDETVDPYKLTFVLKGVEDRYIPDAKNRFKAKKAG